MIKTLRNDFNLVGRRFIAGDKIIIESDTIYHIYNAPEYNGLNVDKLKNTPELNSRIIMNS